MKKYALLIHGPYSTQWLSEIKKGIKYSKINFNQIILVSYVADEEKYINLLIDLSLETLIKLVLVKDLINPGFFNINRQLSSVFSGLKCIENDSFVFKLRNDQLVDFNSLLPYVNENKVITTNCFSRSDRLYHPSDMFLAGDLYLLKEMYSMPHNQETHLMIEMKNIKLCEENPSLTYIPVSPESQLCRYYLTKKSWIFQNTKKDSYEAIKKHYIVLNSWNINYRWDKKRTPFCPQGYIILPHYFNKKPFSNAPTEKARCFLETDFNSKFFSIKDLYYIMLSKIVWKFWQLNIGTMFGLDKHSDKIVMYIFFFRIIIKR